MERGIVIVGGGECGVRAAFTLRQSGYGGPVNIVCDEVHLPYERPTLSKSVLGQPECNAVRAIAERHVFENDAIRLLSGQAAVRIDLSRQVLEISDGTELGFDQLLLATGSRPRRLPTVGGSRRILYLRTYDDVLAIAPHLKEGGHIAILGGGFTGMELAAAARLRGSRVTVLEARDRILSRNVPNEIALKVKILHEGHGVSVLTSTALNSFEEIGGRLKLALTNGNVIEADVLIVGVGARPATELAELAGIQTSDGIAVDARLRTSHENIWAAGDCASFPHDIYENRRIRLEAWCNAQGQGSHVANNMLGAGMVYSEVPWFWSDQYDWSLQITGLPDGATSTTKRELDGGAVILFHTAQDGRLLAASGLGQGSTISKDMKVAELMIERRFRPPREALASPGTRLKALLS